MEHPINVDIAKLKNKVQWKFYGFCIGMFICLSIVAMGGAMIHPGLALIVYGLAGTFLCHVNAKMLDDILRQVKQAEALMAAMPKPTGDILKDFNPPERSH